MFHPFARPAIAGSRICASPRRVNSAQAVSEFGIRRS